METITNFFLSLPVIKEIYEYTSSIQTHMDYEGQKAAERIYQVIITVFGIVGFIWGFAIQQLSATVYIVLGGFALSCLIVLPPWPFFRKHPVPWIPVHSANSQKKESKKRR